jgi:hexosaminidase
VTASGAKLAAANPLGILRGLETFRQLVEITPDGLSAPPRFTSKTSRDFPGAG